jgi:hypothetical protein
VNGSISCTGSPGTYYWGCSQGLSLFITSTPVKSSSDIILPGTSLGRRRDDTNKFVTDTSERTIYFSSSPYPYIIQRLCPTGFDTHKYWYNVTSATPTSEQIQIPANNTLNNSTSYSVVYGEQEWGNNSINGSIGATMGVSTGIH